MANVLPEKMRKSIKAQYIMRICAVALFSVSVAMLIGSVLLIPKFVESQSELDRVSMRKDVATNVVNRNEYRALRSSVNLTNSLLEKITEKKDRNVSIFVDELIGIQSKFDAEIDVRSIYFENGTLSLRVSGIASDRSVLSAFASALTRSTVFDGVDLPLANLVDSKDAPFAIDITLSLDNQ